MTTYSLPVVNPKISSEEDVGDYHAFEESLFRPGDGKHKLHVITNSLRNTFLDCSYKYYLEYVQRLSPNITADYFVWGSFLHHAMERVSHGDTVEEVQEQLRVKIEEEAKVRSIGGLINKYEGYVLLIPHVLDGYLLHYKDEQGLYESVSVETQFSMPLGNPDTEDVEGQGWRFEGRIDEIVKNTQTGIQYVRDLKTPAGTGDMFWGRLPLDSQMQGYVLAAQRSIGIHTNFALYDVVQKPSQQKSCKATDPGEWAETVGVQYLLQHEKLYQRRVIEYPQETIDAYYVELCMLARQIDFQQKQGLWVKHHPGNRIGGCPYFQMCVHGQNPLTMGGFYQRSLEKFNNELEEE